MDDIKDEIEVDDIIPMIILNWSKGSTLIITTCGWSAIGNHVRMNGKRLHVCKLYENEAKILISIHSSWNECQFPPQFNNIQMQMQRLAFEFESYRDILTWKRSVVKLEMHIAKDEKRKKFGQGGG
jgi:hypothetical protein